MTITHFLRDLVTVDADFKPSVQLPFDFDNSTINERLVRSFIPTSQSITIFAEIAQSLDPNSTERARALVGTFGTGKSDLLLMICNYFGRAVDDPLMVPFYNNLREIDPARAGIIRGRREGQPPFLVVLLQADTVSLFPGFVLHGLQHALEQAGMAHLMNKTRYAAAREQIERWQHEGHARYADFCTTLEDHEKIDVTGLLAALHGPQSDEALRRFLRTFKAVTGSDFHVYGYSQPHEAYAGVAEALIATGRYSGIVLVCDEFTAFLERFQTSIDQQLREVEAETKAVENLAERSGSSGRAQVHFIVASLESFASAAGAIGSASVAKSTERSGGRFKQHALQVEGSEELIRGAIKRLPQTESIERLPNMQRDDVLTIASEIWIPQRRNREWIRDKIIDGAFPLHPLSTYALPLINQRVAQSQRTMFLFLKDERGLRGFIQRETLHDTYPGWHRLLTPDILFDYFRESISTKRSDIYDSFERAEQQARTATIGKDLALRILKIVALCETVGSDLVMRPTRLFLRRALNLPPSAEADLDQALRVLEEVDALEAPSEFGSVSGVYRLPARGWVSVKNLRQRITNRAQNLSATDVSKLQAKYPPDAVLAGDYNRKRGSHRKLNAFFVGLMALRSRERLKSDLDDRRNRDGLLWYVVTSSDAERAEAQSLARELTALHSRLIIAVPVAPSHVLIALRDYQALEDLRRDPELDQQSKPYLEDKGKVGHEYKERLDHELSLLADPRQWEWFAAGRGQSGLNQNAVVQLASQAMEKVFPDTPTTNLGQHFKPDDLGSTMMQAVEQMIKGDIQLVKATKKPHESVLRVGAVALGLLQQEQSNGSFEAYSIADPTKSASLASGKIWRRMSEHLSAGKPWANLVRDLCQAPFGLYDSILVLFLAAFITRNADSVAIFRTSLGNRPVDVEPALLKLMLEKPQDYNVRFHQMTEPEKRWLRGIVERGLRQADFHLPPGTTLRAAVVNRLKAWMTRQQIPLFAASLTQADLAELLPESDPATIRAIELLVQTHVAESDVASLLLTDLPARLGAPEPSTAWDQTVVDSLLTSWINVCDQLAQLPVILKERTIRRAAALFGADSYPPEARWGAVHHWRANRSAVPKETLQGLARELFNLTNLVTGSIEQTLLDDFARRVVTVGVEYQRWQDLDKLEKVFTELTRARDLINNAWQDVAHGDEVWREGIVRLVSGRVVSGVTAERAAKEVAAWSTGIAWPACTATLSVSQIQCIYPDVGVEGAQDLVRILRRAHYDAQQWQADLADVLPKELAIQGYTRGEVQAALKRLEMVIPLAASLDARLRRFVQQELAQLFRTSLAAAEATPAEQLMQQWRDRYQIPEPNDLSVDAKGILFHVAVGADDPETLLLTTLPRAVSAVRRPVRQWEQFALLDAYTDSIRRVIVEITSYEVLTPDDAAWLSGILHALQRPIPPNLPRELRRLTDLVAGEVQAWLCAQQLPPFVADLSLDELGRILGGAVPQPLLATTHLLCRQMGGSMQQLIVHELPIALGRDPNSVGWDAQDVGSATRQFADACRLIENLPSHLRACLFKEIGQVFGADATPTTSAELLALMRVWRSAYVILPHDSLAPDARLLYDLLAGGDDDAETLILQRLPSRMAEVHTPYGKWPRWSTRAQYLQALRVAADAIVVRGKVGAGNTHTETLWQAFRERLASLGDDDLRWVIKTFRDEFQQ